MCWEEHGKEKPRGERPPPSVTRETPNQRRREARDSRLNAGGEGSRLRDPTTDTAAPVKPDGNGEGAKPSSDDEYDMEIAPSGGEMYDDEK